MTVSVRIHIDDKTNPLLNNLRKEFAAKATILPDGNVAFESCITKKHGKVESCIAERGLHFNASHSNDYDWYLKDKTGTLLEIITIYGGAKPEDVVDELVDREMRQGITQETIQEALRYEANKKVSWNLE